MREFNHKLSGKTIIKFTATWCEPCKRIAPVFNKLEEEYKNINFYEVDIDKENDFCNEHKISSVPTFIFFNDKVEVFRLNGADSDKLKSYTRDFSVRN